MPESGVAAAVAILNAVGHRGVRSWYFNRDCLRVMPIGWNGLGVDPAPAFTQFEALAVAHRLAEIGAYVRGHTGG